jgi:hypothetical protein
VEAEEPEVVRLPQVTVLVAEAAVHLLEQFLMLMPWKLHWMWSLVRQHLRRQGAILRLMEPQGIILKYMVLLVASSISKPGEEEVDAAEVKRVSDLLAAAAAGVLVALEHQWLQAILAVMAATLTFKAPRRVIV